MPKTVLRVQIDGVAYYLNTETSSPGSRSGKRYRLFKTTGRGAYKAGWISVGSQAGQALQAIAGEQERFNACQALFDSKTPRSYIRPNTIRGRPGSWEGEAFPRRRVIADVTDQCDNQKLTHQVE
jgi:hypothetical protein